MNLYIEIPATPSADLSPNSTLKPQYKSKIIRMYRFTAKMATISAMNDNPEAAAAIQAAKIVKTVWEVRWEPRRQKTQDQRNVRGMLKCFEDGIADALGVNDRKFDDVGLRQERDADGLGCVAVTLMPVGEEQS